MSKKSATQFVKALKSHRSDAEREKIQRYFKADDPENRVIGVRMKRVFDLAKAHREMPLDEIEQLLESPYYEGRMGGVSIMDFQARLKSTSEAQRKALFDLYLARHDRINNWDLVDRAAPRVVGGYLYEFDQPRDVLSELARSDDVWRRRTAIVSTAYFIRQEELSDTYQIAEILLDDDHELIHKAVGSWLREAGKCDRQRLLGFLDAHATRMPRVTLRYAVKHLDKEQKEHYRGMRKNG